MSSTISTAPSRIAPVSASTRPPIRPAIELPSTEVSHQRSMLCTTSWAVNASPLFQVTPGRTLSVYSVPSSLTSQPSSSMPRKVPSAWYSTRYSSQPRHWLAISDQSQVRGSLRAGSSIWMRSVPPCWASWARARVGAAAPIRA